MTEQEFYRKLVKSLIKWREGKGIEESKDMKGLKTLKQYYEEQLRMPKLQALKKIYSLIQSGAIN